MTNLMMKELTQTNHFKMALVVLMSLALLLTPGIINLKITHRHPAAVQSMLQGEGSGFFLYFNHFIFPNDIHIVYRPIKMPNYFYELSLFPSFFKIINFSLQDLHNSNAITIEYKGNHDYTVFTCDGTPLGPQQTMKSMYFIDANRNLVCADLINPTMPLTDAQVMIENVDAMRILYGFDSNQDTIADDYIKPTDPAFSLSNIVTIKIYLLLQTFAKDDDSPISTYYRLGKEKVGPYIDGHPRRIIVLTLPVKQGVL